jgi:hypothetical protein
MAADTAAEGTQRVPECGGRVIGLAKEPRFASQTRSFLDVWICLAKRRIMALADATHLQSLHPLGSKLGKSGARRIVHL